MHEGNFTQLERVAEARLAARAPAAHAHGNEQEHAGKAKQREPLRYGRGSDGACRP